MRRYKCKECGYIHIGDSAPDVCPVCAYDSEVFFLMDEENIKKENEYFEMIDSPNPELLKKMRKQLDSVSRLSSVVWSMYNQALNEGKNDMAQEFRDISAKLTRQSSVFVMFLGEFLEFNSEANMEELKNQLNKINLKNQEIINLLIEDGNDNEAEILSNIMK
ncbi:rubredoxin-like domain-containing protein [Peptostreptococcus equinus]|uniref:Rubrerythrin n=1 Tax=Peptostreptococcus equinus TaxID=3003601 RepID=A0ABY7JQR7_9FIRM|nr:rubrerythrin [Peptostreptococcus sp. CBA3647]WAW15700.1 rubrerythrin [Peptostreptococcus sp. CBA3647]